MKARVDGTLLGQASGELMDMAKIVARMPQELESVCRILRRQTEFDEHMRTLRKLDHDIRVERSKLDMLARALGNINTMYSTSEMRIDGSFNAELPPEQAALLKDIKTYSLDEVRIWMCKRIYGG